MTFPHAQEVIILKRKNMFFCLLTALCLLLTGCGSTNTAGGGKDGSFHIVTSFYPMYVATINITQGVDGVTVTNMTKPQTGCLHDYQLMTEDMKTLEKADAFVINGAGMESFLDKVVEQQKNLKIIDASKGIELLKDDDEENPHVWLSVTDAILQVKNIAEQLKAADPKHADAYEKNAAAYIKKLEALKAEMHAELDTVPNKDIVTFHEAFPYFAKEFGLNIISVVEREPGTPPSCRRRSSRSRNCPSRFSSPSRSTRQAPLKPSRARRARRSTRSIPSSQARRTSKRSTPTSTP